MIYEIGWTSLEKGQYGKHFSLIARRSRSIWNQAQSEIFSPTTKLRDSCMEVKRCRILSFGSVYVSLLLVGGINMTSFDGRSCIFSLLRYSTFLRVYEDRWKDVLKFRQRTMLLSLVWISLFVHPIYKTGAQSIIPRFSQCELCFHYKDAIQTAETLEQKLGALVNYRKHLAGQYADRSICWTLQQLAFDEQSDLCVMQIDGMDQGKFRLPRDPKLRCTASLARHVRPNLKLHGLWIFGILDQSRFGPLRSCCLNIANVN